jgi:two-component system KDP operon response regulator KdpE
MSENVASAEIHPTRGNDLDNYLDSSPRKRALIVDDEIESTTLLKMVLMSAGLDVIGAYSGNESLVKCSKLHPDVILLDLMMPVMDGWETLEKLRGITNAPVLIVSAKTGKEDIVRGLEIGVEDYITKPYHPAELIARVNRVLSRSAAASHPQQYSFPEIGLKINIKSHEVEYNQRVIELPKKEFQILSVLAYHAPETVTNEVLAKELWGDNSDKIQNRIKHLIFVLRQSLERDPSQPDLIRNREGIGYRLAIKS